MKKPPERKDCKTCGKIFKKVSSLKQHINYSHKGIRVQCADCSKMYNSVSTANRHRRNAHGWRSEDDRSENATIPLDDDHISFHPHTIFSSISNVLAFKTNSQYGTHIVAKKDILPGQIVAAATPFACIEYLKATAEVCFVCDKKTKCKVRCTNCIDVWFCSNVCKSNKLHRNKCDARFDYSDCENVRLASEIILNGIDRLGGISAFFEFSRTFFVRDATSSLQNTQYAEILQLKVNEDHQVGQTTRKVMKVLQKIEGVEQHLMENPLDSKLLYQIAARHCSSIKLNSFSEVIPHGKCFI